MRETLMPRLLFHGSSNRDIRVFEPRAEHVRSSSEGPVVFATPHLALAAIFMVKRDNSWTKIASYHGGPWYFVCSDRERFVELDHGGAIYCLPVEDFTSDPDKGLGVHEWVSKKPVKPLHRFEFELGLDAMLALGVHVFFVDKEKFSRMKESNDHGCSIIETLESENRKRGITHAPFE